MGKDTTRFIYQDDYPGQAKERLLSRFRGRKRMEGLVAGLGDAAQTLEDLAFDVLVSTNIEDAVGQSLDQWGDLVGLDRQGAMDRDFRRYIEAQILVNQSTGTTDELLEIWSVLTRPSTVRHHDHFPAGFRLTAYRDSFLSNQVVERTKRIMNRAKPAGVRMSLVEAISLAGTTAGYSKARQW